MNILVAVGAVNSLFLTILVQTKKNRSYADHILSLFLLLTSVAFALVFGALEYDRQGLLLILVFSNLLLLPLFYLYVGVLVNPHRRALSADLLFFIPWLVANLYLMAMLDTFDDQQIVWFFNQAGFSERTFTYNLFYLLDLASPPIFLGLSWLRLQRHNNKIAQQFSDHHGIDYHWLKRLLPALAISWGSIESMLAASKIFESLSETQGLVLGFSLASVMVFYLGYHGFRQGVVLPDQGQEPQENQDKERQPYRKSGLSDEEARAYKMQLLKLMEEEHPYLENDLTIRCLAGMVGLTEHNISEVINAGLSVSFFDFVNGYRVTEFQKRVVLPKNRNITLLALSMECGFSSKSSFNRIFKKAVGMTPSRFLKSWQEQHSPLE